MPYLDGTPDSLPLLLGFALARDEFGVDTEDMGHHYGKKHRDMGPHHRKMRGMESEDADDVVANLAGKIIGRLMQRGVSRSEATRIAREGSRWIKEGPSAAPNFGPAGSPRFQKYGTMNEIIAGRSGKSRRPRR